MAEPDEGRGRQRPARGQARGDAAAWDARAAPRRRAYGGEPFPAVSWLDALWRAGAERLRDWVLAEAGSGRLVPWLPVAFGGGIVLYFTAQHEPELWAGGALTLAGVVAVFLLRRQPKALAAAALLAAAAAGFSVATFRAQNAAHPVLARPLFGVALAGWIEQREERERSDRITIAVRTIEIPRGLPALKRVRVAVRKGTAPPVGAYVALKARLSPPLGPMRPGGYDFARDLYFQRIAATGFALGAVKRADAPEPPPRNLRFMTAVADIRDAIDARIRAELPGDSGAIASALITGKRDAISGPVNDAMYVSSLAHVLSISGYHMAVVAGIVFFLARALLALSRNLANRYPIKKWAAALALAAATFYLILSGAEVATQRSYLMTAIVLTGVLIDRAALTLRTLAVAAFGVLLLAPEAVVHPSFQMSFAATLALVALYERGQPWLAAGADTSLGARIALWGGREIAGLLLVSLVAGLATTLYAAYHFHRLAPYGSLANLLAMPVVSVWVMPMGLLALIAAPFGFDGPLWGLMGQGIDWMIAVALWVTSIPGAVGHMRAFGTGPLLLASAGLLMVCMLRTPLRFAGAALALCALAAALRTPAPDILVAPGAEALAVRVEDGRLAVVKLGTDAFAIREWLAADADPRLPGDPGLQHGFACDDDGCVARLAGKAASPAQDGPLVAAAKTPEAFADDCERAAVVVSRRAAPPGCRALVIDRSVWPTTGALALYRSGTGFTLTAARPSNYVRPWTGPPPPAVTAAATTPATPVIGAKPIARPAAVRHPAADSTRPAASSGRARSPPGNAAPDAADPQADD